MLMGSFLLCARDKFDFPGTITKQNDQYKNLSNKSVVDGPPPIHEALVLFEIDNGMLKYCKGERPYPYGQKWNGAKRIYTVMNIKNTHFIAFEFLMEKGLIQVYDCNIHVCDEPTFLALIQPTRIVAQTTLAKRNVQSFVQFFLKDAWSYERLNDVPSNNSCAAYGPYAYFFY
ncbi:hypothetical protein RDI58_027113 [Solanum bulbocastanum]|uniref:Uncharacterized protein n=1 Tax=Solanum bulbocastanum TaxID=147425 RepID=A0AAN8Y231_SOLBU